jgi:hypothetical protein
MAPTDAWDVEQGYRIRKDRYYLPEIAFTPEEVTALFVAAQGASEETAATQGVRKLLYGADGGLLAGDGGGPLIAGSDARIDRVLAAADAASGQRSFGAPRSQGSDSGPGGRRLGGGVPRRSLVPRRPRWGATRARLPPVALTTPDTDLGEGVPPDGFRASPREGGPAPATVDRASVAFARGRGARRGSFPVPLACRSGTMGGRCSRCRGRAGAAALVLQYAPTR